jgi:hypothetical protein
MTKLTGTFYNLANAPKIFTGYKMCLKMCFHEPWRPAGGLGGSNPPPRNSEVLQSRTGLQIEGKIFSVPIPTS